MPKLFIGGVADVYAYEGSDLIFTANSLTESAINTGVEKLEVRGGKGNVRWGVFFHTSSFTLTLTDALFNMKYIAINMGRSVEIGGTALKEESVTLGVAGAGTVTGTPVAFGDYGLKGWASDVDDGETWQTVTFTGQNFSFSGGTNGQVVCVKYIVTESASQFVTIPGNIIPKTLHLKMRANMYSDDQANSIAGVIEIDVPKFVLDGIVNLNMTANGVVTQSLSGSANATRSADCATGNVYGTVTYIPASGNWYDNITMLAFADATPAVSVGTPTYTIISYGVAPGFAPYLITDVADLTFVSGTPGVATVSAAGVVTRVIAGTTTITVTVTAKPAVQGTLVVTAS